MNPFFAFSIGFGKNLKETAARTLDFNQPDIAFHQQSLTTAASDLIFCVLDFQKKKPHLRLV